MKRYFVVLFFAMFLAACGSPLDGEFLWQFETKKAHMQWADFDEQRFYLCADDVYCLEKETGRLLWEFETFGGHSSAPVIFGGRLFFQCGGLYALDAATGAVLWEFWTKNWATVSPVVGAGRVYASAGKRMYCIDAATGKRLWSVKSGSLKYAPVLIGSSLFFSRDETIFCLDTSNGKVLWRFKVGSGRVQLLAAGENLLSVGLEGLVRVHTAKTGKVQWQLDIGTPRTRILKKFGECMKTWKVQLPFGTGIRPTRFFVLPAGQVLISAGTLYFMNPENGVPLWTFKQKQLPVGELRALGNQVFARTFRGEMFCVSLHDGALIRQLHLPDGGLLLTDTNGAIFVPSSPSREVVCLSVPAL